MRYSYIHSLIFLLTIVVIKFIIFNAEADFQDTLNINNNFKQKLLSNVINAEQIKMNDFLDQN